MEHLLAAERTLSELDRVRLVGLLRRLPDIADGPLAELVDAAPSLEPRDVPADVVTMHSRVRVTDTTSGTDTVFTLCYPDEADAPAGRLSILTPIGVAVLGRRVGSRVDWSSPDGRAHAFEVAELQYQPEASGDFTA